VGILPPFISIRSVQTLIDGDGVPLRYGAQDLSPFDSGAYTGDVSGPMLGKLGCSYVVVGHSERREYHHEDDALVNSKLVAAFRNELTPILCIGESLEVREAEGHLAHCSAQLDAALGSVKASNAADILVQPDIDGALVGGASLDPVEFTAICVAAGQPVLAG
jgi:triosephosphate isomerase